MSTMKLVQHIGPSAVFLGLAACAIVGPETFEKTYPDAFDFQQIDLQALVDTEPVPGSYNVKVFVVEINVCPENARCILPDGISVAAVKDPELPEEFLHIAVNEPRQFQRKNRYILSIAVEAAGFDNPTTGKPVRYMRLLGYSQVRRSLTTQR